VCDLTLTPLDRLEEPKSLLTLRERVNVRLWRMDAEADYGPLNGLARNRINSNLILPDSLSAEYLSTGSRSDLRNRDDSIYNKRKIRNSIVRE